MPPVQIRQATGSAAALGLVVGLQLVDQREGVVQECGSVLPGQWQWWAGGVLRGRISDRVLLGAAGANPSAGEIGFY